MAASGAKSGFGTTLSFGAAVTEIQSVSGPQWSRGTIDVTHMLSDDGYKEFIAGLKDGGEISCELNFIKSVATALLVLFESGAITAFTVTLPSSLGAITGNAIVTGYEPKSETEKQVTATLKLKVSGKPTLA